MSISGIILLLTLLICSISHHFNHKLVVFILQSYQLACQNLDDENCSLSEVWNQFSINVLIKVNDLNLTQNSMFASLVHRKLTSCKSAGNLPSGLATKLNVTPQRKRRHSSSDNEKNGESVWDFLLTLSEQSPSSPPSLYDHHLHDNHSTTTMNVIIITMSIAIMFTVIISSWSKYCQCLYTAPPLCFSNNCHNWQC
jgi:hypothetical protein